MNGQLVEAVRRRRVILFAGAGLSMTLGAPSLDGLTGFLARELGLGPDEVRAAGDHTLLAEYYRLRHGDLTALRRHLAEAGLDTGADVRRSAAHAAVVALGFPVIYTTNYDHWLERAFEAHDAPYARIARVADLAHTPPGATQIIKLHGDLDDEESMVLTETSLFERLGFESSLDIRLRADALARALLFVGYSLSDVNVRYLLYKLHRLWQDSGCAEARPCSYFLLARANPVMEAVLRARGLEPIVPEADEPGAALEGFLTGLAARVREAGGVRR